MTQNTYDLGFPKSTKSIAGSTDFCSTANFTEVPKCNFEDSTKTCGAKDVW